MTELPIKTIEGMQQLANGRGGVCLSAVWHSSSARLMWRCCEGHEWLAEPYRIIRGSWCPVCARLQRRYTLQNVQNVAVARGGLCLSTCYQSNRVLMDWQCHQGHGWQATFASIRKGSWCPSCVHLERRDTLEKMQQVAIQRGGHCLSKCYVDSAQALLWECAKGHRWKATPGSVKHRSWCPVCAKVKLRGTLEELLAIARVRGGECLSPDYLNRITPLTWRCARGHTWQAAPASIKKGSWCRQCYYDNMRSDITNMQFMARARGGACLSETYVDSTSKLQWSCSMGHSWYAIPHSITQGRWCPECSFLAKCRSERKRRRYM
ncbi:zinc-ribbon domain-containing protein [Pseudomonas sp. Ant30-3]|uniref:zinc-ribbon domain-containing protein n=1 Tax=Pseudomonas sp. Ant30-3 TaxID=1488328 RepID=UPI003FA6ACBB